ncbi:putative Glyco_trans_2-like domain-containing protein [Azospirillaceae bacterium]
MSGNTSSYENRSTTPVLSVIVPSFNRPFETQRAVQSILLQKIDDMEIIIVDDASEQRLSIESEAFSDERVRIITHDVNRGAAAARNTGIQASRGLWLAFLDSDDVFILDTLAIRLQAAQEEMKSSARLMTAYVCGFIEVDQDGYVIRRRIPKGAVSIDEFSSGCWFSPGSCLLILRDAALKIGPQTETLGRLEDIDWFIRFGAMGGQLISCNIIGSVITINHNSSLDSVLKSVLQIRSIWIDDKERRILNYRSKKNLLAYLNLVLGVISIKEKRWMLCIKYLLISFLCCPRLRPQVGEKKFRLNSRQYDRVTWNRL